MKKMMLPTLFLLVAGCGLPHKSPGVVGGLQKTEQPEAKTAPQSIDQSEANKPIAVNTELIIQGGGGLVVLVVALLVVKGWLTRNRAIQACIRGIEQIEHVREAPVKVAIEKESRKLGVRDWLDYRVQKLTGK